MASRTPPAPRRRNEWAVRLSLCVGALLLTLPILEIVASRLPGPRNNPQFDGAIPSEDAVTFRRGKSIEHGGAQQTYDAEGFRVEGPATTARYTILFVGDSFTEGYGAADGTSFVARTEAALRASGIDARCLNAGMMRLGTSHELRLMRRILAQKPVDAVVLQLFPFNDLRDNWEDGGFVVRDNQLVEQHPPQPPWYIRARVFLSGSIDVWSRSKLATLLATRLLNDRFVLDASHIELERQLLLAAQATAQKHQVPLLLALVGEVHECIPRPERRDGDPPFVLVRDLVARLNIPWVDLCTVSTDARHFSSDGHYSTEGNALVGQALAHALAPLLRSRTLSR